MYIGRRGPSIMRLPTPLVFAFSMIGFLSSKRFVAAEIHNLFKRSADAAAADRHVKTPQIYHAVNDPYSTFWQITPSPTPSPTFVSSPMPSPMPSFKATSAYEPSTMPTYIPSSLPSSSSMPSSSSAPSSSFAPTFMPSSEPSFESPPTPSPSSLPSAQPTTSSPTEAPTSSPTVDPCRIRGNSFGNSSGNRVFVTYKYEIETEEEISIADMENQEEGIIPLIEAAISRELLPEFFKECADNDRMRQLARGHERRLADIVGISSLPFDEVVDTATCENTPASGNFCTVVDGELIVIVDGEETDEKERVRNIIRSNMYPNTTYNSVDDRIVNIFFISDEPAGLENGNDVGTRAEGEDTIERIPTWPFVVAAFILIFAIAWMLFTKGLTDGYDEDSVDEEASDMLAESRELPLNSERLPQVEEVKEEEEDWGDQYGGYGDSLEDNDHHQRYEESLQKLTFNQDYSAHEPPALEKGDSQADFQAASLRVV